MNTLKRTLGALVVSLGLGLVTLPSSAQQNAGALYGITFFDNQLFTVDPGTGSGTLVANLSASVNGYGVAFRGGNLYTFDPNVDAVRQINLANGSVGVPLSIGVGNLTGEGDIAFRNDGIGFLSSALLPNFSPANDLFRFNLDSGTSVRLGTTTVVLDALAFVGNTLYGIGQEGAPSLYIVNQDTAALTRVGFLGLDLGSPFSALTLGANGQLYGALDDRLYTINQNSGLATQVSSTVLDFGFSSVSGLAAAPRIAAVAETGSTALLVACSFALAAGGLHRTKVLRQSSKRA